ncbi:hypothetical protein BLA29_009695, partial [Euroglyphus maynei]
MEKLLTIMDSILSKQRKELNKSVDNEENKPMMNLRNLKISNPHPVINGASAKLSLTINAERNRGYIADCENIDEGEIIFNERPFVCHFFDKIHDFYCGNCLRRLCNPSFNDSELNTEEEEEEEDVVDEENDDENIDEDMGEYGHFIPCETCSKFIFCSRKCQQEAYKTFHHIECKRSLLHLESQIGIAYLVIRLLCRAYGLFDDDSPDNNNNDEKQFELSNYKSIVGLLSHSDKHDEDTQI